MVEVAEDRFGDIHMHLVSYKRHLKMISEVVRRSV